MCFSNENDTGLMCEICELSREELASITHDFYDPRWYAAMNLIGCPDFHSLGEGARNMMFCHGYPLCDIYDGK